MKYQTLHKLSPLAFALFITFPVSAAQLGIEQSSRQLDIISITHGTKHTKEATFFRALSAGPERYILELEGEAVAISNRQVSRKLNLEQASVSQQRQRLRIQQQQVMQTVKKHYPDVETSKVFSVLFNGVVIQGYGLNPDTLGQIQGIKRVYQDKLVHVQMNSSLPLIDAPAVWQAAGGHDTAGKGIRVAVIDSGIRPENPMFADQGMDAPTAETLPTDDYCRTTQPAFCNNKLIVARHYTAAANTISEEYNSPLGYNSHGSHVAGIATGRSVQLTYAGEKTEIAGVAPAAWLMAYKALYFNGTTASGLTSSLMMAMEDAVADGADVINNSWGGGAGGNPEDSPYQQLYEAAEAAGVIVVTAAGNDGNGAGTIGCPGCIESGITVANTQTGKAFAQMMTVPGMDAVFIVEGNASVKLSALQPSELTAPVISALLTEPVNYEGCTAFATNAFADSYALISRGTCSFEQKALNAAAAGAKAVIIHNNVSGAASGMDMPGATIPGVMISKADGDAILEILTTSSLQISLSPTVTRYTNSNAVNALNVSSSRGPNGNNRFIKPDIAAPGTNIVSAASPDVEGEFVHLSGTSMASPHVAGAAALIKAQHPGWTPAQVKAALTTTSNPLVKEDDLTTPANAFAKGAGLMNIQTALHAGLAVAPVSLSGPECVQQCSFTVKASNLLNKAVSWTGSVNFEDSQISGSLSVGSMGDAVLRLAAGNNTETSILVTIDTGSAERDKWYFGEILWRPSDTSVPEARMPVAVFAGNSSERSLLSSTSANAVPGEVAILATMLTNNSGSAQTELTVALPAAVELIGNPIVSGGNDQDSLSFNENTNVISWAGTVNPAKVSLIPDNSFNLRSLTELGSVERFSCGSSCDEAEIKIDVAGLGMMFLGRRVNNITLGTNGYILFDNATLSRAHINSTFPSEQASAAMLAPFWTDLDLEETGGWLYTLFSDYLVVEWKDAKIFGDTSSERYTFQVVLGLNGSNEVYINYVSLGALPGSLSVGLQDISGQLGNAVYFNGEGNSPRVGNGYLSQYQTGSSLKLEYPVSVSGLEIAGATWQVQQDSTVTRSLLQGAEIQGIRQIIRSELTLGGKPAASALSLLIVEPEGVAASAIVTTLPLNGTVATNASGNTTYTPSSGFSGTDSFGFVLVDEGGNRTKEATIIVSVQQKAKDDSGGTLGYWLLLGLLLLLPQRICQKRAGGSCS